MTEPTITIASALAAGCCEKGTLRIAALLSIGDADAVTAAELVERALELLESKDRATVAIFAPGLTAAQRIALAKGCESAYRAWVAIYAPDLSVEQRFALAVASDSVDRAWVAVEALNLTAEQRFALVDGCTPAKRSWVSFHAHDLTDDQRAQMRAGGSS